MRTGGETGTIGVSGGNLVLGKWQHYVIIVRGNLPVILYVNGTNVENSSTTPDFTGFDNTHPLFLMIMLM